jgi:hypothetical protein
MREEGLGGMLQYIGSSLRLCAFARNKGHGIKALSHVAVYLLVIVSYLSIYGYSSP